MTKLHMANPFYNLDSPDERKEVKQEESILIPGLEGLLRKYEEMFSKNRSHEVKKHIQTIDNILTPEHINAFLQSTIMYEEHKNYQYSTGLFISKLIQNSYDKGNNNFIINTKALKEIYFLGYKLKGKKSKPIEITIEGNTGNDCGKFAKYSNFNIKGNTGDRCGYSAKHSNFEIKGNTEGECGRWAEHSNFYIQGNTGDNCGQSAKYSTFDIYSYFGKEIGNDLLYYRDGIGTLPSSSNCTFITYKKDLYKRLLNELSEGNKAILKDKNGNIIEEK